MDGTRVPGAVVRGPPRGRMVPTPAVVAAFVIAVLLHAAWDAYVDEPVKQTVIGVLSASLLTICVLVARREPSGTGT
jgi:RsiW-degrading membrane proteinase PrsW (M82 family)